MADRSESPKHTRVEPVRILAHRGLAGDGDENCLSAFRAAREAGVTWIETDVNATADGVALTIHDPDLSRVAGVDGVVGEMTAAEISGVRLVHGERIPTVEEALAAVPDAYFNIDVKDEGSVGALPQAIEASGAAGRVLVTSFSESRRRRVLRKLPGGVASSAGYGGIAAFKLVSACIPLRACSAVWTVISRVIRPWVAEFGAMQVPETQRVGPLTVRVVTPRFLAAAHRCGLRVDVWTIDDPRDMMRLAQLGVDGIVTNRADVAQATLGPGAAD
ncbi:glycerophosphodiester phosphodiesterase family protein [Kocuria massiliensis]|uniref:glycerophosphodiester phosphodiesterase family protein n=1 Tax=Kocuria massiliensis TaxID=1926282 RepID=UPI000A1CEA59|nr:glycerophosphodiester phosphodiesterase family protein [Kocuria massiliensis]